MIGFTLKEYHMDVSENSGTPKSSISIGFSIIDHPFWGTPIFGNTHMEICRSFCRLSLRTAYTTYTLGFQPPLKQWVDLQPPLLNPKGFNHRNWVNHFFNGGGSPRYNQVSLKKTAPASLSDQTDLKKYDM